MSEVDIVFVQEPLDPRELRRMVDLYFGDMVKYVVDIQEETAAVGGEMHADAELVLLAHGSEQSNLWGANYYPGRPVAECIEFNSLINIRPAVGNRSIEIQDAEIQARVAEITHRLIGRGEALP